MQIHVSKRVQTTGQVVIMFSEKNMRSQTTCKMYTIYKK